MTETDGRDAQAMTIGAIAAREHRKIRAQLRETRRRKTPPPAPGVGWSTKPDKNRRRRKNAAAELERRAADSRSRWARRHPDLAEDERRLRKERAVLVKTRDPKREATAETAARAERHQDGALARLFRSGAIDKHQLAAAEQIALAAERLGAEVAIKTASLETRVDVTRHGDGTFFENLALVRREMAYKRWLKEIEGPAGAVLEMIVGEPVGFTIVARRYRIHNRKAKRILIAALTLWPKILGDVCKKVDERDLAFARAWVLA